MNYKTNRTAYRRLISIIRSWKFCRTSGKLVNVGCLARAAATLIEESG